MPTFETGICPMSDLPRDTCAHCRQGTRALPAEVRYEDDPGEVPAAGSMVARFPGTCSNCGNKISPGRTVIAPDGTGGWLCENCT